jgi:hypothetical protein
MFPRNTRSAAREPGGALAEEAARPRLTGFSEKCQHWGREEARSRRRETIEEIEASYDQLAERAGEQKRLMLYRPDFGQGQPHRSWYYFGLRSTGPVLAPRVRPPYRSRLVRV